MIYILTVHWKEDKWIDLQLKYFRKHIRSPYKIFSFICGIDGDYSESFDIQLREPVALKDVSQSHGIKLNILAELACSLGEDNDYLIFIDGDAFPVADIVPFVEERVARHKLIAVRRDENNGDKQPHPSFAATQIGFWKEIKGDWKPGYMWTDNEKNRVTDTGGNMLNLMEEKKIDWLPLLRSRSLIEHPLWFGVYEGLIYHHGAGFRTNLSRLDVRSLEERFKVWRLIDRLMNSGSPIYKNLGRLIKIGYPTGKWKKAMQLVIAKNAKVSVELFNDISENKISWDEYV